MDIALATSRDSRHMRSISLVTMVFLPGTFFAVCKPRGQDPLPEMLAQTLTQVQSFFSMTFFNWTGDDNNGQSGTSKPTVSGYLWIYVVVSAVFTLLTVGSWWCFSICRRKQKQRGFDDEEKVLSSK